MQQACVGLFLILVGNFILVWTSPGVKIGKIRFGKQKTFDYDYENVISKQYNIFTTVSGKKSKCVKRVTATGNGVGDVFNLPCSPNGVITTTSSKVMIFGNPDKDTFSFFSDQDSNVIVNQDGKCTRRKYKTVTRQTIPEISDMTDEECKQVSEKVRNLIEQESMYLEVLDNKSNKKQSNEKSSSKTDNQNNLKPISVGNKQTSQNGITVTEVFSSPSKNDPVSAGKPATDYTPSYDLFDTASSSSYLDRLSSKYSKLKTQLSSQLHKPSSSG